MYDLHHNPSQWQEPDKFIPERFDPESPYFKTPSGAKRHPMSFGPFLGGKRICLGKTFAELFAKAVISIIAWKYEFKLVKQEDIERKPTFEVSLPSPDILVTIQKHRT